MTRITVVGCGYLGAVHAVCLAAHGHEVLGVDTDAERVALLRRGRAPFYEPDLAEMLETGLASGNLGFTVDVGRAADRRVHFLCVGTPQRTDGDAADVRQLEAALDRLLPALTPGDLVVGKSTAPVGTAARFAATVASGPARCPASASGPGLCPIGRAGGPGGRTGHPADGLGRVPDARPGCVGVPGRSQGAGGRPSRPRRREVGGRRMAVPNLTVRRPVGAWR